MRSRRGWRVANTNNNINNNNNKKKKKNCNNNNNNNNGGSNVSGNRRAGITAEDYKACLAIANKYRALHECTGPQTVTDELNGYAQAWADKWNGNNGIAKHDTENLGKLGQGENLSWGGQGKAFTFMEACENAHQGWYDEIKDYNAGVGSYGGAIGHYTAMVWKASTKVGFGFVTYQAGGYWQHQFVARYSPGGNMNGVTSDYYRRNVLPCKDGAKTCPGGNPGCYPADWNCNWYQDKYGR